MRTLVVFGSSSDKHVYDTITENLDNVSMQVCSAHRTPALLDKLMDMGFDAFIAGAGLAAHLPGVVASKTVKPVIGVPVNGNFGGMDSLLAIMQMPPGVPVLSVGIDCGKNAAEFLKATFGKTNINLVFEEENKVVTKCKKILDEFKAKYSEGPPTSGINIVFLSVTGTPVKNAIHVPLKADTEARDCLVLEGLTKTGVWVGMNRGENAALAALQLTDSYEDALWVHRKKQRHKIYEANKLAETTYKDASVDIDAGNESVQKMKTYVKGTFNENVLADIGLFGGLFKLEGYTNPVLVASTDGVGTKTKIANEMKKHDTIGQDLVNHCMNDILVQGAKPLFFLDYIASSKLNPAVVAEVVKGVSVACKASDCPLIGGETAEMPGVYTSGEFDLVSAIVGVVERDNLVTGKKIKKGDTIIGLPSTGLHTNGYSLAIKVLLEDGGMLVQDEFEGRKIGDVLLDPHKSYVNEVLPLLSSISGMAHITGGGLTENIPRVLPKGLGAKISKNWTVPKIFTLIQEKGNVPEEEMYRVFNMGIGFVIITDKPENITIQNAITIGTIVQGEGVQYDSR